MTGPFFPSVDSTGRLRDKHLPARLDPTGLNEAIDDRVGSMAVGVAPVTAVYNDTLGQLAIGYNQAASTYGAQCRLHRTGTQTFTAGTIQGVTLNTATFNDNVAVFSTDLATGRITALQAGSYLAAWAVRFAAATAGDRFASIAVNGVTNTRSETGREGMGNLHTVNGVAPIRLLAAEYVNLCVFVSGASVDVQGANNFHTWLSLVRLGA